MILWRRSSGIGGWWPEASGRIRGGFFVESVERACRAARRLEYINGLFPSFRREVFDNVRFDENLEGYAWKEDIDFSYRVVAARLRPRPDASRADRTI